MSRPYNGRKIHDTQNDIKICAISKKISLRAYVDDGNESNASCTLVSILKALFFFFFFVCHNNGALCHSRREERDVMKLHEPSSSEM